MKYYEKYEQRYQAVYAAGGDFWGFVPWDETLTAFLTQWVTENSLTGKRILETCCGEGGAGVILSQLGCGYQGFDLAPSALERAKMLLEPYKNATVGRLDLAQDPIPGQYDGGLDVMGFHMLLTDDDRKGYLRHVYDALKPGAPMVFYNETYRADAYEGPVNSYQQWLDITGEDFVGSVKKYAKKGTEQLEVMIPRMPGRYRNEAGYRLEMEKAGFVVDRFQIENPWRASIWVHKPHSPTE